MARVKRGVPAHKRRMHILQQTKGFRWGRKSKYKLAKQAIRKAWQYAFRDRRAKKRTMRQLWTTNISSMLRAEGSRYSLFISQLHKHNIQLDRKILAKLAQEKPEIFKQILEKVQG
ncbi:MAG: 50S ribosomal protein L20 [Candidatus Wildermuthbacteria bacterium RIFCSPHIGHO2_12_FULL_45_9]|uniref:Large ribosomal subunit protein bL20 n=1 Tax=Candidatus Wildermuthbacteria bacterium RIFCSPHIGHO2_02_FULL_45_25 TaxID=1802450 RepID=A0A1G2R265_9BACT|nr:MAG: 50S ribosomal protein L20 [Candidatus Wildermuthbacteria bacterium RIFCSPHIGHO2_01_FULL_45_20]OHA66678.1 MAG: 50S ribosomal protein L20 [Candidatus Wildermuthbacteria bacterium RIFCSPHIGHO2_02_FULL_45_25]OHA70292.1 MAG: 50S ribosomal protein L20 [Candidatus Wildermuthbacteria bacterium RIFCSPHIGHO2_12_FULL_45_9]